MASPLQLRLAKQSGEALVKRLSIPSLPIDPFAIAKQHNIIVEAKPSNVEGVAGMLLRHGNEFGIMYATHIPSEGFQRFSVAHELGHYFLDGHIDHILIDEDVHISQSGFSSTDPFELEADHFAAGFLMPEHFFRSEQSGYEAGLNAIEELAATCRTSLTATAIRYAELTDDPVAVIMSTGPLVDFCRMSDSMKAKGRFEWIKKSTPLPPKTATARFNANPERVIQNERETLEIDIVDWFGGDVSLPCLEEVVGLGSYGKTLTVLTCSEQGNQDEDSEDGSGEETMLDHWSHRFRQ